MGGKAALAAGLAKAVDMGLCNHVGVCNMNARQMKSMHRKLDRAGVPLVSNQVSKQDYSGKETKERRVLVSLFL
jgi:diketogulonate reductase-like aldo/keto reductase